MQHARVAFYKVKAGAVDEITQKAEAGLLPIFQKQPGFVAYSVIKTGADSLVSLSIWQTRQEAEAAVQTAATWVKENIAPLMESVQNHVGDVGFFSAKGTIGG
jgi:heme-degrading monooxygenase HmoA